MTRRLTLVMTLALSGCAPVAQAPIAAPSAAPPASAAPSAAPTPTAVPSAAPSAAPTSAPAPASGRLRGQAFGLDGQPLAGVAIHVRSLDADLAFDARAITDATGAWAVAGAPLGAQLEARATRAGWTPRVQLTGVGTEGVAVLDFGGPAGRFAGFFLSAYPEIASTSPLADAERDASEGLAYAVTLSEPLDAENRVRFEQALAILPANATAAGGAGASGADDLQSAEDRYPFERAAIGLGPYALDASSTFRAEPGSRARVAWSADGLTATLSFGAPLLASKGGNARYQVVLRAGATAIRDAEGLPLGTGTDGTLGGWPAAGGVVPAVFRTRDLALPTVDGLANGTPAARWAASHDNVAGFTLPHDDTTPRLVDVAIEAAGDDTRLLLTFSEPLAAYDGSAEGRLGAGVGQAAAHLGRLTFAVGNRRDLEALELAGTDEGDVRTLDPRATATFGADDAARGKEYVLDPAAWVASGAGAGTGAVEMGLDARDARTLAITIHKRKRFFDRDLEAIKVRMEGTTDPAGNERSGSFADKDQLLSIL